MEYISVFSEIRCVTIFIYSYKCFAKLQKKMCMFIKTTMLPAQIRWLTAQLK